jgi:hypothetical protein
VPLTSYASPWRRPSASASAHRALLCRCPVATSSRRTSSTVSGSTSASSRRGAFRERRRVPHDVVAARRRRPRPARTRAHYGGEQPVRFFSTVGC